MNAPETQTGKTALQRHVSTPVVALAPRPLRELSRVRRIQACASPCRRGSAQAWPALRSCGALACPAPAPPLRSSASRRWVAILAGMVLVTAAAFGPEQLPPSVAWARSLGMRLFGGVTGLRVVCVLAHLVRRAEASVGACGAEAAAPHGAGTLSRGWAGVVARAARGPEQRARLGVSDAHARLPVARAAAEPQQTRSARMRSSLRSCEPVTCTHLAACISISGTRRRLPSRAW